MQEHFDLIVLGSGSGGGTPAIKCAKAGWRVALIDDQPFGGTCALRGCDPKKILVGAAELVARQKQMQPHGMAGSAAIDWPELMRFKRSFTEPVPARREETYREAGITFYSGHAEFTGPQRISVGGKILEAGHVVIATGAGPVSLNIEGEEFVRSSTDFLEMDSLPPRVAFIGAGYISLEFAHIVQRAGSQAIVLGRGKPLQQFDADLVNRLLAHTCDIGIDLRLGTDVTAVRKLDSGFEIEFRVGGNRESVRADTVIHGAGRIPNTRALNVAAGEVSVDDRGAVRVNEFLQSVSNPNVYSAGDVALPPGSLPLTPVGGHEAAIVAHNLLNGNSWQPDYRAIPSVVFTIPSLASVGLTAEQAARERIPVTVKSGDSSSWYSAMRLADPVAMFKTIVDSRTDTIVGAHVLGSHAEEVINVFALAIRHRLPASALRHMIYAYPSNSSDIPYMI